MTTAPSTLTPHAPRTATDSAPFFPPVLEPVLFPPAVGVAVVLVCCASCWNAAKVFEPLVGGLIPKTIPDWQCVGPPVAPCWRQ